MLCACNFKYNYKNVYLIDTNILVAKSAKMQI